MGRYNSVHSADKFPADKDDGHGGAAAEQQHQGSLDLFASGILVELEDGRVDSHPREQPLQCMAQATSAHAENHDGAAGGQPHHPLQGVLRCRRWMMLMM